MKHKPFIDDKEINEHYRLDAVGSTVEEMIEDAEIYEVDELGEELGVMEFYAAPDEVQAKALKMIKAVIEGD